MAPTHRVSSATTSPVRVDVRSQSAGEDADASDAFDSYVLVVRFEHGAQTDP